MRWLKNNQRSLALSDLQFVRARTRACLCVHARACVRSCARVRASASVCVCSVASSLAVVPVAYDRGGR
eukprot:8281598-Alexandrium_andersonii.AAC.1